MRITPKNAQLGFDNIMPAIALMSQAFWVAWIELIYSGEIYLGPVEPDSLQIIIAYCVSTTAMSLMLIAFGFAHRKVQAIIQKPAWIVGAGALASLATWLDLQLGSMVFVALTGVFTSLLAARFSFLLAQVNPKEIMLSCALVQILASFIYGYVLMLPAGWPPVFMALLPLLGGVTSMLDGGRLHYDSVGDEGYSDRGFSFLRLVLAIGVFSIAVNIVRGFYPSMIEMDTFAEARGNSSVIFFFVKIAVCFVIAALPLRTNLSRLCYYSFLALAFATLPLPIVGLGSSTTLESFGCINALLNLVVWTLLNGIAYKSGRSPIRIFGWGWGTMALCSVVGWLIGFGLFAFDVDSAILPTIEVVLLAVMLVCGIIVVNPAVIDGLFRPVDGDDETVSVSIGGSREANQALEDKLMRKESVNCSDCSSCPAGKLPKVVNAEGERRPGRWRGAVAAMAADCDLSERERDVFELLLKGYTKNRAAEELCISYNTVRSHVRNIYVKCDAHSQQDLIDGLEAYLRERG